MNASADATVVVVRGKLRSCLQEGEVCLTRTRKGWRQCGTGAAAGLCREYVSSESLDRVLDCWIKPHDFYKVLDVHVLEHALPPPPSPQQWADAVEEEGG